MPEKTPIINVVIGRSDEFSKHLGGKSETNLWSSFLRLYEGKMKNSNNNSGIFQVVFSYVHFRPIFSCTTDSLFFILKRLEFYIILQLEFWGEKLKNVLLFCYLFSILFCCFPCFYSCEKHQSIILKSSKFWSILLAVYTFQ